MGLRQRTAANIGWTAFSQAFSVGLNSVVLIVLASILDPGDFGVYAACSVVVSISIQLTTMGLDFAVINSKDRWSAVVSTGGLLRLALAPIAFVTIILLSGPLSGFFKIDALEWPMIAASTTLLVLALAFVPQMDLTKNLRFKQLSVGRVAGALTWSASSLTLAVLGAAYWALVIGFVLSQIVTVTFITYYSRSRLHTHEFDRPVSGKLLRFGGITALGLLMSTIQAGADKFIVGSVKGPEYLGVYYAMYTYGIAAPSLLTGVINAVMFPTYSLLTANSKALRKAYADSLRFVAEFAAPTALGLAGASALFVSVLLGDRWTDGIASLSFLSIAGFFIAMTSPAGNVFICLGRPQLIYQITLAVLLPEIPVAVLAAQQFGIAGVAATVMASEGVKFVYVIYKAASMTGMNTIDTAGEIMPFVVSGAALGALALGITQILGESILTLALALVLGLAVYMGLALLLSKGKLRNDIKEILTLLRNNRTGSGT